ncbi:uncharacterized protein LOC101851011 [Aplysia californica]|uniref:Uncharacterized protein LOC101851011 n=1 Tax=Aplysia californica TaxID=6500 RepID=A0ABM0KAZ3_APLCA|nr:uncharacterized protein LOC101851011 [Aplysia californica]
MVLLNGPSVLKPLVAVFLVLFYTHMDVRGTLARLRSGHASLLNTGKRIDTNIVRGPVPVASAIFCTQLCLMEPSCTSYFVVENHTIYCQMHSVVFMSPTDDGTPALNTLYYQLTQDGCPLTFVLYRPLSLCYAVWTQLSDWSSAQSTCQSVGAHLVHVSSPEISQHLSDYFKASSVFQQHHIAIGVTYSGSQWKYTNGSSATWLNWASGEPSHITEECVVMAYFYDYKWNDVPCSGASNYFVCQIDM